MVTTQNTEYLVTACPDHGEKVVGNLRSFAEYVSFARDCDAGYLWLAGGQIESLPHHDAFHLDTGTDCWRCCAQMVIDPLGELDY